MKWKLRSALIVAAITAGASASYAQHSVVLIGLDTAKHYHGKANHNIYVRVDTFSHEANAIKVRDELRSHLHYPVTIARRHGYYSVTVGPLASAEAARKVGEAVQTNLQPSPKNNKANQVNPISTKKPIHQTNLYAANTSVTTTKPVNMDKPVTEAAPIENTKQTEPATKTSYTHDLYANFMNHFKDSSPQPNWNGSFFLSAGVGDSFNRADGTNNLGTGAGWPDDEYVPDDMSNQPYFALSAGYTWARPGDVLPYYSLGIKLSHISTSTVTGYVDQYSLPDFRNYNFQYDVQLFNILGTAKADLYRWKNFMPYVTGGIGLAHYSTSQYSETATSGVTPRVNPAFGSGYGTNLSYSLGLGLDYAFMQNLWFNLEYNYTSFGTINTGNGQNYATLTGTNYDNESLKHSLSATSIFLGLTYYVG